MLKTNNIRIKKIEPRSTNISVIFEEPEVRQEQYNFFKDRLNKYKLYINSEYSFKSELKYEKSSRLLSIGISLIIPDHYLPEDPTKVNELLMDPINTFQMFYDVQNQIYKRKHGDI